MVYRPAPCCISLVDMHLAFDQRACVKALLAVLASGCIPVDHAWWAAYPIAAYKSVQTGPNTFGAGRYGGCPISIASSERGFWTYLLDRHILVLRLTSCDQSGLGESSATGHIRRIA